MSRRVTLSALFVLACLLAWPSAARAQSAITGVVKDDSGAVLPGVTVEAASDALIEKSKSVVTDGEGVYRIVDLRPGLYLVTFSLEGFSTIRREGINLPSEFTATIDASMKVGALEESITVTGDAPVVDDFDFLSNSHHAAGGCIFPSSSSRAPASAARSRQELFVLLHHPLAPGSDR
jgi:hypothetical protein